MLPSSECRKTHTAMAVASLAPTSRPLLSTQRCPVTFTRRPGTALSARTRPGPMRAHTNPSLRRGQDRERTCSVDASRSRLSRSNRRCPALKQIEQPSLRVPSFHYIASGRVCFRTLVLGPRSPSPAHAHHPSDARCHPRAAQTRGSCPAFGARSWLGGSLAASHGSHAPPKTETDLVLWAGAREAHGSQSHYRASLWAHFPAL